MIHSVKVKNYVGNEILMKLADPEPSGFLVFNMTGLGPEKGEIRTTDIVTGDGGFYNSSRLPSRNITMMIRYFYTGSSVDPDTKRRIEAEFLRHKVYKFFPIKQRVELTFTTDSRVCWIEGYLESNEPVIFSKETHTQLSIICPFPYFYDAGPNAINETVFWGTKPLFMFPFMNNHLTTPLIIFGDILNIRQQTIDYDGDAEIGVRITIDVVANNPVGDVDIWNVGTRELMRVSAARLEALTGSRLKIGDHIEISTIRGSRYIRLYREGIWTNVLNVLGEEPWWHKLVKGPNTFAFEANPGAESLIIRIFNKKLYEGV